MAYYRVHYGPPLVPILSHFNPVHTTPYHLSNSILHKIDMITDTLVTDVKILSCSFLAYFPYFEKVKGGL
jgi:hypothetical protein